MHLNEQRETKPLCVYQWEQISTYPSQSRQCFLGQLGEWVKGAFTVMPVSPHLEPVVHFVRGRIEGSIASKVSPSSWGCQGNMRWRLWGKCEEHWSFQWRLRSPTLTQMLVEAPLGLSEYFHACCAWYNRCYWSNPVNCWWRRRVGSEMLGTLWIKRLVEVFCFSPKTSPKQIVLSEMFTIGSDTQHILGPPRTLLWETPAIFATHHKLDREQSTNRKTMCTNTALYYGPCTPNCTIVNANTVKVNRVLYNTWCLTVQARPDRLRGYYHRLYQTWQLLPSNQTLDVQLWWQVSWWLRLLRLRKPTGTAITV